MLEITDTLGEEYFDQVRQRQNQYKGFLMPLLKVNRQ